MVPYDELLSIRSPSRDFCWTARDAVLYALAIGIGDGGIDDRDLRFLYERDLMVVPTFATVAAWGSNPPIRDAGIDYGKLVHAAQEVEIHQPLPPSATVRPEGRMVSAVDKGDKGALVEGEVLLRDAETGVAYVTNRVTWFARADGHFGGPTEGGSAPHAVPDRAPDRVVEVPTRHDQAALYRLLGDENPLHIDPSVAARAGFQKPILHGLCTFGITCRAVMAAYSEMDAKAIRSHAARFTAPVVPGETLAIDLWRDADVVSFEVRVPARGATVLRNGRTLLA